MGTVLSMTLGKLANICLPAKILTIDERNSFISLLVRLMVFVCVEPRLGSSIASLCWLLLNLLFFGMSLIGNLLLSILCLHLCLLNWLGCDFVLSSDDCNFDCVRLCLDRDRLLHLVVSLLLSVEAVYLVLVHAVPFFADGGNGLHKADHSFVALRVEFAVVARLNVVKFLCSLSLWKGGYVGLDCVFEVGKETKSILQLNLERLIINCRPGTHEVLVGTVNSVLAEDGLNLELGHQFDLPDVLLGKGELMVFRQDLKPIFNKMLN